MGGSFPNTQDCDATIQLGTHNLDLSGNKSHLWDSFNTTKTTYSIPPEIIARIGGDEKGGATIRAPEKNWDSNDLGVYFTRVPNLGVRTATRAIPTSTSTSKAGALTGGKRLGTIFGAALGGLIFLAFLLLSCLWMLRKIKKRREEKGLNRPPEELDGTSHPTELYTERGAVDPKYFTGNEEDGNGTRAMQAYFHTEQSQHPSHSPRQQQHSQVYEMDDASGHHTPPPRHVPGQGRSYSAGSGGQGIGHAPLSGQGRSYSTGNQSPRSAGPVSPPSAASGGVFSMGPHYPASQEPAEHPALRSQRIEKGLGGAMGSG